MQSNVFGSFFVFSHSTVDESQLHLPNWILLMWTRSLHELFFRKHLVSLFVFHCRDWCCFFPSPVYFCWAELTEIKIHTNADSKSGGFSKHPAGCDGYWPVSILSTHVATCPASATRRERNTDECVKDQWGVSGQLSLSLFLRLKVQFRVLPACRWTLLLLIPLLFPTSNWNRQRCELISVWYSHATCSN